MRVLVTGADGFVGRAVCGALARAGETVVATTRSGVPVAHTLETRRLGDLERLRDPGPLVKGVDAVVHLAARVHVIHDHAADPDAAFRAANVEPTLRIAEAARDAGVRRLVFVSSVKVHGERTSGRPFTEADPPRPGDPYARSKWEAERALASVASGGLEVSVLRPPLVYGPGVKANFRALIGLCDGAWPLPLGSVMANRRSLVYVEDLAAAVHACLAHPSAAGRTYLVASGPPVSTATLVRELRHALGRPARLFPTPPATLRLLAQLVGRTGAADRLLESLEVDAGRIGAELGWRARWSLPEGLKETVAPRRRRRELPASTPRENPSAPA